MKVAYFSPLNPIRSGISDYSEELLERLAGYGTFDLFVDDYRPSASWLYDEFKVKDYRSFRENKGDNDYDINVYHVGNNDNHAYIWKMLQDHPGLTVLHEPILHHFVFSQTVGNNRVDQYLRELDYSYNSMRPHIVKATLEARDEDSWYDYPLIERIVDSSLGIVVHSEFARGIVLEASPRAPVRKIASHYAPPAADAMRTPGRMRESLGFGKDDFVVGSFGYITYSKRIHVLLEAVSAMKGAGCRVKLLLVGEQMPGCDARVMAEERGLERDVVLTGFVDTLTFWEYITVPDVCVALRYPSAGETSGSVIKMMGSGRAVVLSDNQAFSEFPDDCCVKVPVGGQETEELTKNLIRLMEDPAARARLGAQAKRYIETHHDIEVSARSYAEFMWEIISGRAQDRGQT